MRDLFAEALYDALIAVKPGDVAVSEDVPRDPGNLHIWIADIDGTVTYPVQAAGQWIRDDTFTVTLWCQAETPGMTGRQARRACQRLVDTAEQAVFGEQAAIDAAVDEAPGTPISLEWTIGAVSGPNAGPGEEGAVAYAVVQVEVHGRRSGTPL